MWIGKRPRLLCQNHNLERVWEREAECAIARCRAVPGKENNIPLAILARSVELEILFPNFPMVLASGTFQMLIHLHTSTGMPFLFLFFFYFLFLFLFLFIFLFFVF